MKKKLLFLLVAVSVLTVLPFLGLTDFNTKGEPREAVVAYSMLHDHNWILPVNNGGEMAYKPPFFHWCVATCSLLTGAVTEYTSRLPSAVALLLMVWCGFAFYARRTRLDVAFIAACVTLTNFEVHRAGMNCRVDMVLTALIVGALYALFRWQECGARRLPWWAILLMSAATLTKGPVGFLLPCMVVGVFLWMRGFGFWRMVGRMALTALLSCVLPALWYVAAYRQGGDDFLALIMEENFGRFLGKMSYESHVNPAYYNVLTLLSGYAPYTLLVLLSFFTFGWRRRTFRSLCRWQPRLWWSRLCGMSDVRLYSLLASVLIFVFYCIPKSKRSVYLLPVYPFLAYFLAEYMVYLLRRGGRALRLYGYVLSSLAFLLGLVFVAVRSGWVPDTIFHGKHAAEQTAMLQALRTTSLGFVGYAVWAVLLAAVVVFLRVARRRPYDAALPSHPACLYAVLALAFSLFMTLDGVLQPTVLNVKSDKPLAAELRQRAPEGPIYSYVSSEMMHFFTINFYEGNRVVSFEKEQPREGYLLVGRRDFELLAPRYQTQYAFREVWATGHRSCDTKDEVLLYTFRRVAEE